MTQYIVVDGSDVVRNIVEWDGALAWAPPSGMRAVAYAGFAEIGTPWTGSTGEKVAAPTPCRARLSASGYAAYGALPDYRPPPSANYPGGDQ
jgi:hypothetical protein